MRGVEDFIYLLAIAFAILIILGLASVWYPYTPPANFTKIAGFELGLVGWMGEWPAKSYEIGTVEPGTQKEILLSIGQVDVEHSYWSERKGEHAVAVPAWGLEWIRRVKVKFDVWQTNKYGRLRVLWNGRELLNSYADPREYVFVIEPNEVFNSNMLIFEAEDPGMRFWASTVYTIRDVEVELEYGPARFFRFELLPSEVEVFNKGKVSFYGWGKGNLSIKVNGREIYNKRPIGADEANFTASQAAIVPGENTLSFRSIGEDVRCENTRLEVWLLTQNLEKERTFNISEAQYAKLGKGGKIRFNVAEIRRAGGLSISLNGNALAVPQVQKGWNEVSFSQAQARSGLNAIKFTATGTFDISSVEIGY